MRTLILLPLILCGAACQTCAQRGNPDAAPTPAPALAAPTSRGVFGGARPATLIVPSGHDRTRPVPLLIVLHGYGSNGAEHLEYLGYRELAERERILLLAPDGTRDGAGLRFWNASAACCNFERRRVDDVAYLMELVREIGRVHALDRRRLFVVGHSNGGYMAYRLACSRASEIAAIVSIAGAMPGGGEPCSPSAPVSVLQVHGDADRVVLYAGGRDLLGRGGPAYPGAEASVARWARHDGCSTTRRASATLDLDGAVPGPETVVEAYAGCPAGIDVRLWRLRGGGHVPSFSAELLRQSWQWLARHPRPAR